MATFEEALPGIQAQTGNQNIMDALSFYNANYATYNPTASSSSYSAPDTPAAPMPTSAPDTGGISSLPAASDYTGLVQQAYKDVLGRAGETGGVDWWASQLASGKYTPDTFQSAFQAAAAPEISVQNLYKNVLGREYDMPGLEYWAKQIGSEGITPEEYKQFYAAGVPEIVSKGYQDVLGRSAEGDTGAQYWTDVLKSQFLAPQEFAKQLAYGAQGTDIAPAQQYLTLGPQSYAQDFAKSQPQIEKFYGLEPGTLATNFTAADFANKSPEEIRQLYQQSGANRFQEAYNLSNIAKTVYGYSDEQAKNLVSDLVKGQSKNETINSFYDELLKGGMSNDVRDKILQDAAVKTPDSPFFQANPQLLQAYTPLDIKEAPRAPGQYGYSNNAPILSAKEADKLLGGEVIKGGNNYFGYGSGTERDDALGWDLRSKYAGAIANGAGIFGVNATTKDITDFDKIEKEIQKLGGVKTETDAEGNVRQVVYKDVTDPETGQKVKQAVDVRNLFPSDETTGVDAYKTYEQTKDALAKGAQQLGLNPANFGSVKSLFDAVNDKAGNLYVVTGRANKWDPAVAEAQGITGVGQDRGGINHAQVLYQKVGDKLMPVQTLKTFNFDDPNTSRGFFGDLATGIASIASIPPIAIALAAATGGISGLAAPLTTPVTAALVEAGLPQLLASSATNALTSGVLSELTGGDWKKGAGSTLVSNLIGGAPGFDKNPITGKYEQTFTPGYVEKFLANTGYFDTDISRLLKSEDIARIAGIYAGSQISGLKPEKILINQLINQGIRSLPKNNSENLQSNLEELTPIFPSTPESKIKLYEEAKKAFELGEAKETGVTGLLLNQEDWMIDALKQVVPVLMSKGLNKADATLLASNLIGAASKG